MKKVFGYFGVLLFFISISCFAKEKLYVGTNAEFKPFEYMQGDKIVGFDVELMNEIANILDKEIVWKNMSFEGLLPALQSQKIDVIIAGMTATNERKKYVNFSEKYYETNQMIVKNKENNSINSFEDLKGHKVGVVLGFTGDIAVSKIDGINVERYNGTSEAIMALKAKKIEAVVIDSEPAKNYVEQNKELGLIKTDVAKEEYAIATRKNDEKLILDINKALLKLKENGTYDKLIKKYFVEK